MLIFFRLFHFKNMIRNEDFCLTGYDTHVVKRSHRRENLKSYKKFLSFTKSENLLQLFTRICHWSVSPTKLNFKQAFMIYLMKEHVRWTVGGISLVSVRNFYKMAYMKMLLKSVNQNSFKTIYSYSAWHNSWLCGIHMQTACSEKQGIGHKNRGVVATQTNVFYLSIHNKFRPTWAINRWFLSKYTSDRLYNKN
jgi:hypothetical protein